jgi:hypothetical protein
MSHEARHTPIPRGYDWITTITYENDAYLLEMHGENRKITEYHAFGALRNAQSFVSKRHGRILWEPGKNVWYGHARAKERV